MNCPKSHLKATTSAVHLGPLGVATFLMFGVALYKTSVGGRVPWRGTEKLDKKRAAKQEVPSGIKGTSRGGSIGRGGREGSREEREGTHCKLNLKAGQMGAVMVARAPLFHPS